MTGWLRWLLVFTAFDVGLRGSMALGVKVWSDWIPFDAHDIGLICALVVWVLIPPLQHDARDGSSHKNNDLSQ